MVYNFDVDDVEEDSSTAKDIGNDIFMNAAAKLQPLDKSLIIDLVNVVRTGQVSLKSLEPNRDLNDSIIYWVQEKLKTLCKVNGLQDTLMEYREARYPSIRIHHLKNKGHWVVSAMVRSNDSVEVFDSLNPPAPVSPELLTQLKQIYPEAFRVVRMIPVQQQLGSRDCGLFACAFACEICLGNGRCSLEKIRFDQSLMRSYLMQCIVADHLDVFPLLPSFEVDKVHRYV